MDDSANKLVDMLRQATNGGLCRLYRSQCDGDSNAVRGPEDNAVKLTVNRVLHCSHDAKGKVVPRVRRWKPVHSTCLHVVDLIVGKCSCQCKCQSKRTAHAEPT